MLTTTSFSSRRRSTRTQRSSSPDNCGNDPEWRCLTTLQLTSEPLCAAAAPPHCFIRLLAELPRCTHDHLKLSLTMGKVRMRGTGGDLQGIAGIRGGQFSSREHSGLESAEFFGREFRESERIEPLGVTALSSRPVGGVCRKGDEATPVVVMGAVIWHRHRQIPVGSRRGRRIHMVGFASDSRD